MSPAHDHDPDAGPDAAVPVLTDGVVTLRTHLPTDVDAVTQMCRDPEFARWTTVPVPYDRAMAEEYTGTVVPRAWRELTAFGWAIEAADDAGTSRFAGNLDVRTRPRPDIGYGLHPWARGRGLMARAVRLATRWAFDTVGMPVMHWECHAGNFDSWRVAWACGFSFQGTAWAYSPQRGELRDAWLGVLKPADAQRPRARWLEVPVLEGDRVRLRPHTEDDLPLIVQTCRDPRTRHWLSTLPDPYTLDSARAFVASCRLQASLGKRVGWAVADPRTDRLIGDIGVFGLDNPGCPGSCEIGYLAHPSARGRGAVTEAVRLAVRHAFTPEAAGGLGCHRARLGASWGNTASRHVADAAGFRPAGRFRLDGRLGDGTYEDGAWYDLLPADLA